MKIKQRNVRLSCETPDRFLKTGGQLKVLVCTCLSVATVCFAGDWSWEQESGAVLGYDSNVYGERQDEIDDLFLSISHRVNLRRAVGTTLIDLNGRLDGTVFESEDGANDVDSDFSFRYASPYGVKDITQREAQFFYRTQTGLDLDTGRRLQPEIYGFELEGEWDYSPKIGFIAAIGDKVVDRTSDGLSKNETWKTRLGISHAWAAERKLDLEYSYAWADSSSGIEATHHVIGSRLRGKILPKIEGDVFIGYRSSSYSGSYDFSDSGPEIEIDLGWLASPVFSVDLGVRSEVEISSNGRVKRVDSLQLAAKRELGDGYRFSGIVRRGSATIDLGDLELKHDFWAVATYLEYDYTSRMYGRLSADLLNYDYRESGKLDRFQMTFGMGIKY